METRRVDTSLLFPEVGKSHDPTRPPVSDSAGRVALTVYVFPTTTAVKVVVSRLSCVRSVVYHWGCMCGSSRLHWTPGARSVVQNSVGGSVSCQFLSLPLTQRGTLGRGPEDRRERPPRLQRSPEREGRDREGGRGGGVSVEPTSTHPQGPEFRGRTT